VGSQPGSRDTVGSHPTPSPARDVAVPPEELRRRQLGRMLLRARAGDRRALDEIVDRLMPLVWNVARAQGLDSESAADVVQASWVTLLEHLSDIRSPEALAGWLITVTRREARKVRDGLRRVELGEPAAFTDLPDPSTDLEEWVADRDQYYCLWRNLRKLSARCQELLRIVAFVDRPNYTAVSEKLGMPRGGVGPTRGRCLTKLRSLLAADPTWSRT